LVPLIGLHVQRNCSDCGKTIHVAEPGKGGQGIKVEPGDTFVAPAGSLNISLDLKASSGRFSRSGITWFVKFLYFHGSPSTPDDVSTMLEIYEKAAQEVIDNSNIINVNDLNDPAKLNTTIKLINREEDELAEWWALLIQHTTNIVREALEKGDSERAVWAMSKIACFRFMLIFKQSLEEHVWRGYVANQFVYDVAAAAAQTPAEAEAIKKLEPLFSKMDESVLHTWVKDGQPIGPRIRVTTLPEETLKALAEWHLSLFDRKREEEKRVQEEKKHNIETWYQGIGLGATVATAVVGILTAILKAMGKI